MWEDPVPREISVMFARAMYGPGGAASCRLADGRRALLERNPSPGVILRARIEDDPPEQAYPLAAFAPASVRPSGYPLDLPFLPERPVTLAIGGGQRILGWMGVPDSQDVIQEVIRQSLDGGWQSESAEDGLLSSRAVIHKNGWERVVLSMVVPPILKLIERRTGESVDD